MKDKYFAFLAFGLLTSCTVGPDYRHPRFYTNQSLVDSLQINNTERYVSTGWYRQFNDRLLNRLVLQGLNHNPDVGAAVERLRQSRNSLRIAAVNNFPMLDADASYSKIKDSVSYGIPISTDYYQLGLDASWELDIWGGGRRQTEEAMAVLRAAASELDNVKLTLTAEIANNYINLRRAQEQLRIAEHNLKIQREIYQLVKTKYDVGLADAVAYNQSRYIVETTKELIPAFRSDIEAYRNALSILIGRLPGELNDEVADTSDNLVRRRFDYPLSQLYDLPVTVVRSRPDVQVSEMNLIAQNAKIGQAIAQLFPSVSLSGFLGYQGPNVHGLVSSSHDMYSFAPKIGLPLFHWGQLEQNVELQKSATRESLLQYQSTLLNAASEIRNSMVNVEQEYRKNEAASAALAAQKQVAGLTLDKYKQGLIDFSDVLTSQQDLLSAENSLTASNAAVYQNIIAFYKAVGGGYCPQSSPKIVGELNGCRR